MRALYSQGTSLSHNSFNDLRNWRAITLLNVDYKILARIIAMHKGPYGQNIRLLGDLISYTESNIISGIFLFVDFEKAFDSLEWDFLHRALKAFNFGPAIRKRITVL